MVGGGYGKPLVLGLGTDRYQCRNLGYVGFAERGRKEIAQWICYPKKPKGSPKDMPWEIDYTKPYKGYTS